MTKLSNKFLTLLFLSLLSVSAQSSISSSQCNQEYVKCLDKCKESDMQCLNNFEDKYDCDIEENVAV